MFLFWDDYRPVEYAHDRTITVSLFLSLFIGQHTEIQVSQAFNDGNKDVQWKRGAVFTAKCKGLWDPTSHVSSEDVDHIRNRCQEFVFSHQFPKTELKTVDPCVTHMAKWIVEGANSHDASMVMRPPLIPAAPSVDDNKTRADAIQGMSSLLTVLHLQPQLEDKMLLGLEDMGAVDVKELDREDWEALEVWHSLRVLQKRRLLQFLFQERSVGAA